MAIRSPRSPGRVPRAARPLLLAAAVALGGCYAHLPASPESLQPQQRVRAHLSPAAAERVAEVLGTPRRVLDGVLVRASRDEVVLLVPAAYVQAGLGTTTLSQELRFEPGELLGLQRRELDRTRTAAVVGAGAVVVAAVIHRIFSGESGGTTTPPPGGGSPEARVPVPGGW